MNPVRTLIPEKAPRARGPFSRWLGRQLLRLWGWRLEGQFPPDSKLLLVAAPHTSNWDWVIGVSALLASGLQLTYIAKHSAFKGAVGWLMRYTGGVPVDRSRAEGKVDEIVEQFATHDRLYYVIAPEGTRKSVDRWKTGFLRVAYRAEVPVVMLSLDYDRKEIRVGDRAELTGDLDRDLREVQNYYRQFRGRNA